MGERGSSIISADCAVFGLLDEDAMRPAPLNERIVQAREGRRGDMRTSAPAIGGVRLEGARSMEIDEREAASAPVSWRAGFARLARRRSRVCPQFPDLPSALHLPG